MSKLTDVAERQILRKEILSILAETNERGGATKKLLQVVLEKQGYDVSELTIGLELRYLAGKGLVQIESISNPALGIKKEIVQITSMGIDQLEGTIQVDGIEAGE